jgi:nucleolin
LYSTEPESSYDAVTELTTDTPAADEATSNAPVTSDTTEVRAGEGESAARSVYIGNIYFDITEEQLKELCSQYGAVEKVRLMKDVRGFSRG